ncbi:hypothetical protein ACB092_09G115600 [Castanea dentata]
MQYLGYCTVCNCTNHSRSFNLTTPYFHTSPVQVGNPCFHFTLPKTLHSLNLHALCHSFNASSPLLAYLTQTHQQKQRKKVTHHLTLTLAPFLVPDQREHKG